MRYQILYQPSYSLAVIDLDPSEEIQAESGAMVSMSGDVTLKSEMKGGFLGALKRSVLGGESFFVSRFQAGGAGGEVTLAPTLPGDIAAMDLQGQTVLLKSGAYLAASAGLNIDSQWGGARGFFGAGGLFLLRVSGAGTVLFNSYGALHAKELRQGERYIVDTWHVIGFSDGMGFQVKKATAGWIGTVTSGEGLVCEFTGPGTVYMQTRNEQALVDWIIPKIPSRRSE